MLTLTDVSVAYDGVVAVDDVSLEVPDGSILAVLGPSGCGKSTLLRAIAGLEPLTAGTIAFDGVGVDRLPTHKRGFALMFQDGQLFAHMTVARNVGYALRLRGRPSDERVAELLALVGLEGYADRLPATLSGGERQRVALARALAVEPRLLLLDEPLSALDTGLRERLAVDLREILHTAGTTALMVTHDHEEAFHVADRLAVMRAGRVVQSGPIGDVWAAPVDTETALFLGYARVLTGSAVATVLAAVPGHPGGTLAAEAVAGLAVRRSALVADEDGRLRGTVESARATPELVRLVVDVGDVGLVDAVAPRDSHWGPGETVRLRVDPTRVAPIRGI
ncbi:ABC transporter ATP-binding protein [Nocardioides allogilvus]|uniref:ABC transporter ATP-binding protein n=1 Tax=Nocardioides allogilvus TaxID=2072017 RepID=UPI000D316B0D|nr:ABC transporter ATP-binding protein [Nocardioides allogilvus]